MAKDLVTTISGKIVDRSEVRSIGGKFYQRNVECFLVNGNWHRFNNGKIAKNLETGQWDLISNMTGLRKVIFGFLTPTDHYVGFCKDVSKFVEFLPIGSSNVEYCPSEEALTAMGFVERMSDGIFIHSSELDKIASSMGLSVSRMLSTLGRPSSYGIGSIYSFSKSNELHKSISKLFNLNDFKTDNKFFKYLAEDVLPGITFGVEYEVSNGFLPRRLLYKYGLIPLRDGSTNSGVEFATLPLGGAEGYQLICDLSKELDKRSTGDQTCSWHVHIGGLPRTKLNAVSLFSLITRLQSELKDLIHPYKTNLRYYQGLRKLYSKDLTNLSLTNFNIFKDGELDKGELELAMDRLWYFMTGASNSETVRNKFDEGQNPWGGSSKWNIPIRYTTVNFYNYFFTKSKTIEFRLNTPTFNYVDNLMWVIMCSCICRYAVQYPEKILSNKEKIRLLDVLEEVKTGFGKFQNPTSYGNTIYKAMSDYIEFKNKVHLASNLRGRTDFTHYISFLSSKSTKDTLTNLSFVK